MQPAVEIVLESSGLREIKCEMEERRKVVLKWEVEQKWEVE